MKDRKRRGKIASLTFRGLNSSEKENKAELKVTIKWVQGELNEEHVPPSPTHPITYPSVVMMASDTITRSWVRTSASFTARLGFIIRGQKAQNILFQVFNAGAFSRRGLLGALQQLLTWDLYSQSCVANSFILSLFTEIYNCPISPHCSSYAQAALSTVKMWDAWQDNRKMESFATLPVLPVYICFFPILFCQKRPWKALQNQITLTLSKIPQQSEALKTIFQKVNFYFTLPFFPFLKFVLNLVVPQTYLLFIQKKMLLLIQDRVKNLKYSRSNEFNHSQDKQNQGSSCENAFFLV